MLLLRKLVESTAVNAVCALPLASGLSVILAAVSECVHVYDVCPAEVSPTGAASPSPSSSATADPMDYVLRPRGHVFDVGCGVVSLLALANQCFVLWTRDQECMIVRYQANLSSALVDRRVMDGDHVCRPNGEPAPVHYKEHHWYVVHRVRLWCPDTCASVHPPEMGVNDSMEMVHLRFCAGHVFLVSIKWDLSCLPGQTDRDAVASTASNTTSTNAANTAAGVVHSNAVLASALVPSLRTTRWHTCDYMRMYAGTRFHYPAQSCSVATRRPGESAAAHQQRIEQLWESGSAFANIPDEDLIATHAVMELSKRKTAPLSPPLSAAPEKTDWTGVRAVSVRRETYSSTSPLMPSPAFYCNAAQGGFTNVRTVSGQTAVHHAPLDFFVSRSTALKDEYAAERIASFAVAAPRRASRRGLDWTLLAFLTSPTHTAVYHLQRARNPLGAPHYVLDGLFAGSLRVLQVLFCTHSGDASNDVWVVLSSGAVTRFSVAMLRAREAEALQVQNAHRYPWPTTAIAGLPHTFLCRRLLPADSLFHPGGCVEALVGSGGLLNSSSTVGGSRGAKNGLFSVYPCTRRYALLSDCVQDVYVVDLVERRVIAAIAGDGPMTDVCEAPHGYVAAFARGVLRYVQPGMQLYVRGTARMSPFGVPIHAIRATRVLPGPARGVAAGVYVMISTHNSSQLYRVEDGNMCACTSEAWAYEKNGTTLAFEAVSEASCSISSSSSSSSNNAGDTAREAASRSPTILVQCATTRCVFGATVHCAPAPLSHAAVAVVSAVGPVCVGVFREGALAATHLVVMSAAEGVCVVDVAASCGDALGPPSCVTARGTANASIEVLVGRWDGCVTVSELRHDGAATATLGSSSSSSSSEVWHCIASQVIRVPFGMASPVQQFLSLPRAGRMSRWMATHSSGEVSILALARRAFSHDDALPGSADLAALSGWTFAWAPTSPPHRRAQQKLTCATVPVVRAPAHGVEGDEEGKGQAQVEEVYNGFDGALLQPRDGALLFFSVPLEEGDTQAPPHMQRPRERDEEDREWVVRLENTVRAIVPPDAARRVGAASWRCAVLLETVTPTGTLHYDALVVQRDEVTLFTLDSHLFAAPYPRQRAGAAAPSSSTQPALPPPPRRAYVLACTGPSRYICTQRLQLPQLSPHETLISIAREPDDEGAGVLLCVTVCEQTLQTRLTTLHSGTLAMLESLVLDDSIAHWMCGVRPSTPSIARAAPLFLLCSQMTRDGTVRLQVVAVHPLRIVSHETLEDSPGWMDVASHGVKVDGAVQVVPTRISSEVDTYGGEVLVTVVVDYAIHLFVLRGYKLLFQHCVLAPACVTSVTLCYPIVSVCTEGDSNVYLQVYPVNDDTEVLAPSYASEATRPLKTYGRVSWKMRVSMREPSFGACVLAQAPLYDRCIRTDVEGDVTVMFVALASASSKAHAAAAHMKGEDLYVGSAEGPQAFLTHSVRLPTVPMKARVLRHVAPIQRRYPRQLQCCGHAYHLQSSSVRKDLSSRLVLLPCHDGSLYGAFEIPYGFAHPLMRLEQVITDAYALNLSFSYHPSTPGVLQQTYHLQPFHVARGLQPLTGTRQAEKQACVVVDAVLEYYLLRDMTQNASCAEGDAAVVRRKFTALDDVVQTLLSEEYGKEVTVDSCAEMLNLL